MGMFRPVCVFLIDSGRHCCLFYVLCVNVCVCFVYVLYMLEASFLQFRHFLSVSFSVQYVCESHSQQSFLGMIKMYNIDKAFNMLIMQK